MALFLSPGNGKPADPLTVIRSYLALAIQIGAPAYNHGDHRGCYEQRYGPRQRRGDQVVNPRRIVRRRVSEVELQAIA